MAKERLSIITPQSLAPIGLIVGLVLTILGAKSWLDSQFASLRESVVQVQYDLRDLRQASGDRWTPGDMRLWTEKLGRANPTLQIPAPEHTGGR